MNRLRRWLRGPLSREFDDPRRNAIVVTHHAKEQAGERYRRGDPWLIIADVASALAEHRVGRRAPSIPVQKARRSARLAWTEDCSRIYVIYQRNRAWLVLTALPTDETSSAAIAQRRFFRPDQGLTAVASALELARERPGRGGPVSVIRMCCTRCGTGTFAGRACPRCGSFRSTVVSPTVSSSGGTTSDPRQRV